MTMEQGKRVGARWFAVLACTGSVLLAAQAAEVKLTVREPGEAARAPARVTTGIPFARGTLKDAGTLTVSLDGKPVPAQFRAHAPWDDGSVRWALMNVLVPVGKGETAELTVTQAGGNPASAAAVTVENGADRVRMSNGIIDVAIPRKQGGLFEYIRIGGAEQIGSAGRGLFLTAADGQIVVAGAPSEVTVESEGPIRAVVRVRGTFPDVHDGRMRYTARISVWAGAPRVTVHLWLENHGAMGYRKAPLEWFSFRSMGVEFGLELGETIAVSSEGVQAENRFRLLQRCQRERERESALDGFEYVVSSGETELKKGERSDGVVELKGERGRLTTAIREFWENYEKAIEVGDGRLRLWLWPEEGQWPRAISGWRGGGGHPLYDESMTPLGPVKNVYKYPGGIRKGHEFVLDFSETTADEIKAELNTPLYALASAETYAATDAAPGLFAPAGVRVEKNREANFKLASWERMQRSASDPENPTSVFAARLSAWRADIGFWRDVATWYGWMDFGDLSVPGRGQVGVEGWARAMYLNALRFGDAHAMKLGSQMARHTIDIDQLWSDRDLPGIRGLQKRGSVMPHFHSMHLKSSPGIGNQLAGLALHYMLTGEPMALEACLRNGESLIEAWKILSPTTTFHNIGRLANTLSAYTTLYELTADKKWLDEAMALFNMHVNALWKRHGPHLHSSQQIAHQGYGRQDQAYCLAIQWLCELHHATGDETVLKLLKEGCEREFNKQNYYDAPTYLSGLFAYVGLKTGNADYLRQASSLFAESFPESRSPPVFMPGNSQWHNVAGNLLRSGHLLQYGWWMHGRKTP